MRMTIAMGALCSGGVIVAADTLIVMSDGATSKATKVLVGKSNTCSFAIANATEDGNAANTLIPEIQRELEQDDPGTLLDVETNVKATMAKWVSQYPHGNAPPIQMVMGVYVDRIALPQPKTGGGVALYYCEPPNTMVAKELLDDCRGYHAIGLGSVVTDPLYRTLFAGPATTRTRLLEISYLMYRAKKDMASGCGGDTNAVLVRRKNEFPFWINNLEMRLAEKHGEWLDRALSNAARGMIEATGRNAPADLREFSSVFKAVRNTYHESSIGLPDDE
jgi:hypothetical protein